MADRALFEWTDSTWTPVKGCTRTSEGCRRSIPKCSSGKRSTTAKFPATRPRSCRRRSTEGMRMTTLGNEMATRGDTLLRLNEVTARVGLSRSSIYRFVAANQFPAPMKLGPGAVRWKESEVLAWMERLPASGAA